MATEDERTRPTFAGAVAALWLEYVHNLVLSIDDPQAKSGVCDRIEACLRHLESSSMPIPNMTLEDVIEMGREIDADLAAEELDERAADYLDSSSRAREKIKEESAGAEQAPDSGVNEVEEEEAAAKPRGGYCASCGHHGATNAHRDACLGGVRREVGAENLKCKKCGQHIRSRAHRKDCGRQAPKPPEKGGPVKCKRCGGQTYLDGEGDIVCLQCGDRAVAPQFGEALR